MIGVVYHIKECSKCKRKYGDELEPGETRQFEIMHKYNSNIDDIKLSVKDVN